MVFYLVLQMDWEFSLHKKTMRWFNLFHISKDTYSWASSFGISLNIFNLFLISRSIFLLIFS